MRECGKNRGGYDRVLMAVAATFLTVSASSAWAQGDQLRGNAADLAIDAAIPRPEPANLPPPTPNDFKLDPTEAAKVIGTAAPQAPPAKPAEVVTVPVSEPHKANTVSTEANKVETNKGETSKAESPASEAKETAKETAKTETSSGSQTNDTPKSDTATVAPSQA